MQYFGKPEGRVKIQMMSKNLQRYYTLKCLIRDLLSNVFVSPKFWLAKVFDLSRSRGNEMSTNIVCYFFPSVTNPTIWLVLTAVRIFLSLTTVTVTLAWFFFLSFFRLRAWKKIRLENTAFSRPWSQFFTIRTDPKSVNNIYIFVLVLRVICNLRSRVG